MIHCVRVVVIHFVIHSCMCSSDYTHLLLVFFPQSELDNANSLLNDVEGKSIKATKDHSAVQSQLQDVQV